MASQQFDAEARYAQLGERVDNQGSRITHLEATVTRGFSDVAQQIAALGTDLRNTSKTPWPIIWSAIGVCFTVFFSLAGAFFWPVRTGMDENRLEIRRVANESLSVAAFESFMKSYELNRQLFRTDYKADLQDTREQIARVRDDMVSRRELEALLRSLDSQIQAATRRGVTPP